MSPSRVFLVASTGLMLSAVSPVFAQQADISSADQLFFESKVRPILIEHCYDCHAADAQRVRGGLLLDTKEGWEIGGVSGPAIAAGDVEGSLLIEAIRWDDEDFQMPPRRKMSANEIATLEDWVRRGAPDPRFVAQIGMDDMSGDAGDTGDENVEGAGG